MNHDEELQRRPAGATQPSRRVATSTVEDYLKSVLSLEGQSEGERVSMGALGSDLRVAPGTVTAMMKTLSESGLVDYEPYSGVRLTQRGRTLAMHVLRRHRLIELFLVEVLQLDWSQVHEEAELLEHAVSDRLVERMDEMLGFPEVDPHGDPIPSSSGEVREEAQPTLLECAEGASYRVVRVLDQSAPFLRTLERSGLVLGARVQVRERSSEADAVELRVEGQDQAAVLGFRAAAKIRVASA